MKHNFSPFKRHHHPLETSEGIEGVNMRGRDGIKGEQEPMHRGRVKCVVSLLRIAA
jgi:hypothetical protein